MNLLQNTLELSIERLRNKLLGEFDENRGSWCGRQWMSVSLTAEYLLLRKYLNLEEDERILQAIKEIEKRQNKDGGFSAYTAGPSEKSISSICHLALELYQEKVSPSALSLASKYINEQVEHKKTLLIARFYQFLFGKATLKGIPQIRPGLILLPKWTGVSIYDLASWLRSWLVPISILWHYEKYNPQRPDRSRYHFYSGFLRKKSIAKIEKWILKHQEQDGSWYGVFSSTMISLMALHKLGYTMEDKCMKMGLSFIHTLQDKSERRLRQQAFLGPIWDTAHAILALSKEKSKNDPKLRTACDFLLDRQNHEKGDWSINNKGEPGAWGFQYINKNYPDVDDTAVVLKSLKKLGLTSDHHNIKSGLQWLLSMQNKNGSWAAFDKNNHCKLPELYLNLRRYYIGNGPGLILDSGTPDLTAHVLETLAGYGYGATDPLIRKALQWLRKQQEKDGSWFGRWGLCYLYGTSAVLTALDTIGEDMSQDYIQDAVKFLIGKQNSDGGFGEVPEAYFDKVKRGLGPSEPTQTSWVVLGLLAAGKQDSEPLKFAIKYLLNEMEDDGSYPSIKFQAVAAPPLYQRYELYTLYYPLMALNQYQKVLTFNN